MQTFCSTKKIERKNFSQQINFRIRLYTSLNFLLVNFCSDQFVFDQFPAIHCLAFNYPAMNFCMICTIFVFKIQNLKYSLSFQGSPDANLQIQSYFLYSMHSKRLFPPCTHKEFETCTQKSIKISKDRKLLPPYPTQRASELKLNTSRSLNQRARKKMENKPR